jgi:uncharacterized protein
LDQSVLDGLPLSEIAALIFALLVGAVVTGFLSGLLGIGGGGVMVPVMYEIFRIMGVNDSVRMQVCVATSLAVIVPTSLRSARGHWQHGAVDLVILKRLAPWIVAGAVVGVLIAAHAPSAFLKGVFVASALFMASRMAFPPKMPVAAQSLPGLPWDGLVGWGIGMVATLIGIGGAAYLTAYMRIFGRPIHTAVGTASALGPIIAIPAAVGYIVAGWGSSLTPPLSLGFVSILGLVIIAPVSVLAAPLGVRIAHGLKPRTLEYAFIAFLLAVALRFTVNLIFGF